MTRFYVLMLIHLFGAIGLFLFMLGFVQPDSTLFYVLVGISLGSNVVLTAIYHQADSILSNGKKKDDGK